MSNPSRHVVAGIAVVLAIAAHLPGHAQINQWQYTNSVHSSLTFTSEQAAHADILAAGSGYAYVTEKVAAANIGATQVSQRWKAPNKDPVYTNDWVYTAYVSPYTFSSEAAVLAAYEAAVLSSYAPCGIESFQIDSAYTTTSSFLGLPTRQWKSLSYNMEVYGNLPGGGQGCLTGPGGTENFGFYRDRTAACVGTGYGANQTLQKCVSSYTADTYKKPITCPCVIGDPGGIRGGANVANGDQAVREIDYSGPGIEIEREFHSFAFSGSVGLGVQWSHNFSGYLVGTGSGSGVSEVLWYFSDSRRVFDLRA